MTASEPLLDKYDQRWIGIAKAAWKLEDSIAARLVSQYPSDPKARELHLKKAQAWNEFQHAMLLMVVLSALETPTWCDTSSNLFSYVEPEVRCTIPGVPQSEVLLSNLPYIPPGWGVVLEVLIISVITRKLLLDRKLQTSYFERLSITYHSMKVNNIGLALCAMEMIDCLIFIVFRPSFRMAPLFRTGYLLLLPNMRRLLFCIFAVLGEMASIGVFYAGTIVFFAWIAVVMFDDVEGYVFHDVPINKGFDSFGTTLNTMFIAGSTDDFLDAFLPTYTAHRASGLLWFVFLFIVHVLLLNLVLDTLVAAYTGYAESKEEEEAMEIVNGIREAFRTVQEATGEGLEMSKETFMDFAREFSRSPGTRDIPEHNFDIIFRAVDADNSGKISEREFFSICGVIQYEFWTTKEDSPVKDHFPALWNSGPFQRFRAFVRDGRFEDFFNFILMVNLVLVICESVYDINGWKENAIMENLELLFSLVYVMELGLKLCVWDFSHYWALRSNQFDFFTTWALLASSVLDEYADSKSGQNIKRYMNMLRLLRLLRVLKQLKRLKKVQLMVETICCLVSASKNIMMFLGVVIFFFSSLGVQLWGGILYKSNAHLEETGYEEKKLWVLNFNDFGSAFGVWIVVALREYVPDFPEAVAKASDITGSWLVFICFYLGGVCIVFELVKAFTIEAFMELHKRWGSGEVEEFETLHVIEESIKSSGLCLHYRVVGDTSTHEKILKALQEEEEELEEQEHEHAGHENHG